MYPSADLCQRALGTRTRAEARLGPGSLTAAGISNWWRQALPFCHLDFKTFAILVTSESPVLLCYPSILDRLWYMQCNLRCMSAKPGRSCQTPMQGGNWHAGMVQKTMGLAVKPGNANSTGPTGSIWRLV